ncbi:Dual specificity protein phosphatase 14, partial [Nibea albiflora]
LCVFRFEGLSSVGLMKRFWSSGPFIRPNAGFWRQLMDYERALFNRTTVRMVTTPAGVLPKLCRMPRT